MQEDPPTVICRGTITCCIVHSHIRGSRCARCLSCLSRSGHHRDHPKPFSDAQWYQRQQRSPRCGAPVLCAHVDRVHVGVCHVKPKPTFSQAPFCKHKCRVSMYIIHLTPELIVVPLADDESEWISVPINVRCSNCILLNQLITRFVSPSLRKGHFRVVQFQRTSTSTSMT